MNWGGGCFKDAVGRVCLPVPLTPTAPVLPARALAQVTCKGLGCAWCTVVVRGAPERVGGQEEGGAGGGATR